MKSPVALGARTSRPHLRAADTMRAMILEAAGRPLREVSWPVPSPGPGQVLLRVAACGVCRTDLCRWRQHVLLPVIHNPIVC